MMPPRTNTQWKRIVLGILAALNILTALITVPIVFQAAGYEPSDQTKVKPESSDSAQESKQRRATPEVELWRQLEMESVRDPLIRDLLTREHHVDKVNKHRKPWQRLKIMSSRVPASGARRQVSVGSVRNDLTRAILIKPREACDGQTVLFIGICSAIHHFDLRYAIRRTWGSYAKKSSTGLKIVFFLGNSVDTYKHLQPRVQQESEEFGDIVQDDIIDNYRNLTLKSLSVLKWTKTYCKEAKFIMKSDDDVFVNIPNLVNVLQSNVQMLHQRFILGYIIKDASPIKDRYSKWFTPDSIFRNKSYPTYASGSAYIVSGDLVGELLASAERTSLFWLEDVFITGILASKSAATLIHNDGFTYRRGRSGPCDYLHKLTGHEITAEEMLQIWSDIHTRTTACGAAS